MTDRRPSRAQFRSAELPDADISEVHRLLLVLGSSGLTGRSRDNFRQAVFLLHPASYESSSSLAAWMSLTNPPSTASGSGSVSGLAGNASSRGQALRRSAQAARDGTCNVYFMSVYPSVAIQAFLHFHPSRNWVNCYSRPHAIITSLLPHCALLSFKLCFSHRLLSLLTWSGRMQDTLPCWMGP